METVRRSAFLFALAAVVSGVALADSYSFLTLDVTGGAGTAPRGINSAGQVVGTYTAGSSTLGFLYSGGTFSTISVPGAVLTSASGIDSAGQIVGFYDLNGNSNYRGFLDTDGTFSFIDIPGARVTQALGINDAGQIVGTFTDFSGEHGFLYVGGAFVTIDVPGAISTSAGGVNNAGEIVGTYTDANSLVHGFLYTDGVFSYPEQFSKKDGATGGEQNLTLGINDAGQIVGVPAFLYSAGIFSTIELPGAARGTAPVAINNAGQIAGFYYDASGAMHGFLATPTLQPSLPVGATPTASLTQGQTGLAAKRPIALTSGAGACDVTGSPAPDVADVQRMINEALGKAAAVNDLNGDGVVDVADIQVVINAALKLGCATGQSTGTSTVANLTALSGNGQAACVCISATLQAFQPLSVMATDKNGVPVAGATVIWTVTSGPLTFDPSNIVTEVDSSTSVTNAQGIAIQAIGLFGIYNDETNPGAPYLVSTVQATTNNLSVTFTATESLHTSQDDSVIEANPPTFNGAILQGTTLSANIGTTLSTPIQTKVAGFDLASNGVPNISVSLFNAQTSPELSCGGAPEGSANPGSVLSDSLGNTNCYPAFSGSGTGTFYVLIGAPAVSAGSFAQAQYLQAFGPYTFTSIPGAPASVEIVSGNNQVAPYGQQLNPMVAKLVDANGNAETGQTMVWSVIPAGAAALNFTNPATDSNGEVSETGSLDGLAAAGVEITVALASNPNIKATFQETVPGALTALNYVSGNAQTAQAGTSFANPLVVQLFNASGPVPNFLLRITATSGVSLPDGPEVSTNANGEASISVAAGSLSGTATVTVVAGALQQTFSLTIAASPAAALPRE
jgi:probable HAF family extracellular repeat protein